MAELDWVQTLGTFGVCIAAGIIIGLMTAAPVNQDRKLSFGVAFVLTTIITATMVWNFNRAELYKPVHITEVYTQLSPEVITKNYECIGKNNMVGVTGFILRGGNNNELVWKYNGDMSIKIQLTQEQSRILSNYFNEDLDTHRAMMVKTVYHNDQGDVTLVDFLGCY